MLRTLRRFSAGASDVRRPSALIAAAALAVIVLAWAGAANQIALERRTAVREALVQNANQAMMLQQYVTRTLEAANIAALHIAELYVGPGGERLRGTPERPALIRGPIPQNPSFLGLSIADADGNLVATTLEGTGPMPNVRQHPAFQAHVGRDDGALYVSRPAFSRVLRRNSIWLSRRINGPDGRLAGVVAINMDPAQLTDIYEQAAVRASEVAWVVGFDGVIRSRRTSGGVTSGENIGGTWVMALQRRAGNGTYEGRGAIDGKVRYISQRRIAGFPLFVSYSVLKDDILRPVEAHSKLYLGAALLVTLVALGAAAAMIGALRRRERRAGELAAANQRLEEAQRIGRMGDWTADLHSGALRWSPQLFVMYQRDPALGPPYREDFEAMLDPRSLDAHRAAVRRVLDTGQPESWEVEVKLPSGAAAHHRISAVATKDGAGRVAGIHGTIQDITEARKLERLQAEIAHLSRIEAMNAMAATLAHELNQPLTAASNYLSLTRRYILAPERGRDEAAKAVEAARGQIGLAGEIIRRARSMVAKEPTRKAPVALGPVIDDAIALVGALDIGGRIVVEREVQPGADVIVGDRVQVQQVLMNLIRNAWQAASESERPRIAVRSAPAENRMICISVEDNGPGFGEEGARPFTPFVSGKEDGLGLGLSISRTIIEAHGGQIWAGNAPDGGACVSFTLPAADPG